MVVNFQRKLILVKFAEAEKIWRKQNFVYGSEFHFLTTAFF